MKLKELTLFARLRPAILHPPPPPDDEAHEMTLRLLRMLSAEPGRFCHDAVISFRGARTVSRFGCVVRSDVAAPRCITNGTDESCIGILDNSFGDSTSAKINMKSACSDSHWGLYLPRSKEMERIDRQGLDSSERSARNKGRLWR